MPTRQRVQDMINYVQQGKIIDAMKEFYSDDIVMQDNKNPPTRGKEANLKREQAFVDSVKEIHENRAASFVVDADRSAIEWILDFTNKQGQRLGMEQVAYQTWRGEKIVHERFYYDSASVVVK